jgi:hypothetical protein
LSWCFELICSKGIVFGVFASIFTAVEASICLG